MSKDFETSVGLRIRALRIEAGLKQAELARLAGIDSQDMSRLERAQRRINISDIKVLADALQTSMSNIMGERFAGITVYPDINQLFGELSDQSRSAVLGVARAMRDAEAESDPKPRR